MKALRFTQKTGNHTYTVKLHRYAKYGNIGWRVTYINRDRTGYCPYTKDNKDFGDDYDSASAYFHETVNTIKQRAKV